MHNSSTKFNTLSKQNVMAATAMKNLVPCTHTGSMKNHINRNSLTNY